VLKNQTTTQSCSSFHPKLHTETMKQWIHNTYMKTEVSDFVPILLIVS